MVCEVDFAFFNFHYSLTIHDPSSASRSWIVLGRQNGVRSGQARVKPDPDRGTGRFDETKESSFLATEFTGITKSLFPSPRNLSIGESL
jgi:hypothetical protein